MAYLIKTGGQEIEIEPKDGHSFSLEELQEYIGGYIELLFIKRVAGDNIMVVNEEGILKGLPYNIKASIIKQTDILGDVVILKSKQIK